MTTVFPDNWVTRGWSRGPDGTWIEVGHCAGVVSIPPPAPPQIGLHDVAVWLNSLEASHKRWKGFAQQLRGNIYRLWEQASSLEAKLAEGDGPE